MDKNWITWHDEFCNEIYLLAAAKKQGGAEMLSAGAEVLLNGN